MRPEKVVALIMGAASDVGRAIARLFAGEGATGGGRDI
jgi:NAD(P)-dependent dehydrogenase (short-subunit alcohol dehydrogenase family)